MHNGPTMNLAETLAASPAASLIMALNVGVSLLALYAAPALLDRNLLRPYWLTRRREYHTIVTSGVIHADLGHLLFNSLTFWFFGFALERRIGTAAFALLYLAGLLVSSLGTWWKHRRNPNYASLGASGAVLAVLFASIVYFPDQSIFIIPIPVPIPAPLFALGYLGWTWWSARNPSGRINHDAHLGGALTGLAFVALADPEALRQALAALPGLAALSGPGSSP